jgi:hypothetical protein
MPNFLWTNFVGPDESPNYNQPANANLSSKLCIYELPTESIHSYLARSHYTWATLYLQIVILSS